MIFAEPMLQAILDGRKTQTRRRSSRYRVGKDYALQAGRGRPGVPGARIRITEKRRQRLGEITTTDAIAEGFEGRARFLDYWAALHGRVDPALWVYAYEFELLVE